MAKLVFRNSNLLVLDTFYILVNRLFPVRLKFRNKGKIIICLTSTLFLSPLAVTVVTVAVKVTCTILQGCALSNFVTVTSVPVAT